MLRTEIQGGKREGLRMGASSWKGKLWDLGSKMNPLHLV